MTSETRATIRAALAAYRGDDLYRAKSSFRGFNAEEMQKQAHGDRVSAAVAEVEAGIIEIVRFPAPLMSAFEPEGVQIEEIEEIEAKASIVSAAGHVPIPRQTEILRRNPGTSIAGVLFEETVTLADHPDLEFVACPDLGCWVALRRDSAGEELEARIAEKGAP